MVVVLGIEPEMKLKAISSFCRAPGATKEAIDVGSNHRSRVVEVKKWVKAGFLKLPLSHNTSTFAFDGGVNRLGTVRTNPAGVLGVLIT